MIVEVSNVVQPVKEKKARKRKEVVDEPIDDGLISLSDAAKQLGVSKTTLIRRVEQGKLTQIRKDDSSKAKRYLVQAELDSIEFLGKKETYKKYYMTAVEIAAICVVTKSVVYGWVNDGLIQTENVLKHRRIPLSSAEAFLDSLQVTGDWRKDTYCTIPQAMKELGYPRMMVLSEIDNGEIRIGLRTPSGKARLIHEDVVKLRRR